MSERKETGLRIAPAPWTWEEHELSEGYSCIVYDANGHRIGADHLSQGDAALIAAAPALYEALSPVLRGASEADYYCPDDVADDHTVLISFTIAELRAARSALLLAHTGGTENG